MPRIQINGEDILLGAEPLIIGADDVGGATTLVGTLFADADVFGAGTIVRGAVALAGIIYTDADTFGAGLLVVGSVTVVGTLYSDADTFGIISNGSTWRFCKLTPNGKVYQTGDYSTTIMDLLLGQLRYVFMECNQIMIDRENPTEK